MINTSESRIIFNGNGTATEFPYSFAIINDTDVKVMTVNPDGVETVLDSDYYVDVTASKVIYPGYPPGEEPAESERPPVLPTGWQLVVYRDIPITQEANLGNVWPFNVIEDALDKITMILQNIYDGFKRSFKVSQSAPADIDIYVPIEANKALKWNADGTRIVTTVDPADVLPQAQNLLQQTTEQANIATNKANAAAESALAAATSETNAGAHEDKAQAWAESETSPDGEPDSKSAKTWAGDSADSAELAQKWAESDESPDGETDTDSPTGDTMSSKEWALYAKQLAQQIGNPVVSVTESNGTVTVAKSDGAQNTFGVVKSVNGVTPTGGNVDITGVPTGTILPFAGSTIPNGFLACNGAAVSRTTYAALYSVIGTTYGTGNGSTTFNLPNAESDKFLQGNSTPGMVKAAGLPNLTGNLGNVTGWNDTQTPTGVFATSTNATYRLAGEGGSRPRIEFNASKSNSIYGKSNTVQPPAVTVRYIIKY